MKHKTIGQLAKQAKISVRTLHHYDAIGLLKPAVRADNAYRFYNEYDERRLRDVLFFRALG
ncbi:MAG: MerR family DNA-binding transcriptional regulator, partial [Proteobacteria bacterium]|nr:MerR family DNA-binding transcriptional regulator [Pseudomonadota bacterium]